METITPITFCPDCGARCLGQVDACKSDRCPGTAAARWAEAIIAERQLIEDFRADDGMSKDREIDLVSRLSRLEPAFSAAYISAESRAWIRAEFAPRSNELDAAVSEWGKRARPRIDETKRREREAERFRLDEIRSRYAQHHRLTIDELRFLLNHDDVQIFDAGPDEICNSIESLLAGGAR